MQYNGFDRNVNYYLDRSFRSNQLYSKHDLSKRNSAFFRWGYLDTYNMITGARDYIFFTKPKLYLFDEDSIPYSLNPRTDDLHNSISKHSSKLCALYNESPHLFHQLTRQSTLNLNRCGNFMPLFTNNVNSSLDLPGVESEYSEMGKTQFGAMRSIRGHSLASNNEFTFSLEFNDNKFLEIYKMAIIYDEYMSLKSLGMLDILKDPTNKNLPDILSRNPNRAYYSDMLHDLLYNIDSDLFTVYKITVADDGETILHYAKLWGVSITNVPRDAISNLADNDGKITIPLEFKAEHISDLDPLIISDFNKAGGVYEIGQRIPTYCNIWDEHTQQVNGSPVGTPFIIVRDPKTGNRFGGGYINDSYQYKLKFLKV